MNFGLINEIQVPRPWNARSEYEAYWNAVEQARVAETAGFTHVWAVEHHFREEFSHMSAPEVWLATVAQHTTTLRIGHGIVLLPHQFNHPIRVAERIAALDIVSNGRVEFGTGRSIAELEIGGFGIDPGDTMGMWEESVSFLHRLWSTEDDEIEFEGKYFSVPGRRIFPRPLQKPHPPMWMAATSPASYARAGEHGLGVLAFGMAVDKHAIGRRLAEWHKAMAETSRPLPSKNEQAAVFMMGFCAKDAKTAKAMCEEAFVDYLDVTIEQFVRWGEKRELPPGYEWYAKALKQGEAQSGRTKFEHLMENQMMLVGTPDEICETIQGFKEVGATQMLIANALGRIAHEDVLDSIRLFGEAVIPNFR